jgi:hypothetical protein
MIIYRHSLDVDYLAKKFDYEVLAVSVVSETPTMYKCTNYVNVNKTKLEREVIIDDLKKQKVFKYKAHYYSIEKKPELQKLFIHYGVIVSKAEDLIRWSKEETNKSIEKSLTM